MVQDMYWRHPYEEESEVWVPLSHPHEIYYRDCSVGHANREPKYSPPIMYKYFIFHPSQKKKISY